MAIIEEKYSDKYYILNGAHDSRYPLMTTRLCIRNTRFVEEAVKDVDCPLVFFWICMLMIIWLTVSLPITGRCGRRGSGVSC